MNTSRCRSNLEVKGFGTASFHRLFSRRRIEHPYSRLRKQAVCWYGPPLIADTEGACPSFPICPCFSSLSSPLHRHDIQHSTIPPKITNSISMIYLTLYCLLPSLLQSHWISQYDDFSFCPQHVFFKKLP